MNICARVWKGEYGGVKALMGGKENFFNLYVLPKETKNEFPLKT